MWVFTRYGFFSIACGNKADGKLDAETVMVRARLREHLKALQERFAETEIGKAEILNWSQRDYRYRIVVPKTAWAAALTEMAMEQTWSNFKNEAGRFARIKNMAYGYVDALHSVWEVMYGLQGRSVDGRDTFRAG